MQKKNKNKNKKTHFFPRSRDLLQRLTLFSILHHLYPVIFAKAAVVAFVQLRNCRFNFHCYTQREPAPTQKSARMSGSCDLSRLLVRKITKGIQTCKPATLNRPINPRQTLWSASNSCTFVTHPVTQKHLAKDFFYAGAPAQNKSEGRLSK